MRFENPEISDGINVSKEHPLKEFSQLLIGIVALIAIALVSLYFSVGYLAQKIPFKYEQKLVKHIDALQPKASVQQKALQLLADRLSAEMDLPEGMKITVHYSKKRTVNAFATMGGNVFFYKGLIDRLPSENALAMVMAHEIAHIKHRHPMVAAGRGLTVMTLGSFVSGASGSNAGEFLIKESTVLGLLKFSRNQESQADLSALKALHAVYGNVQGAKELFDVFSSFRSVKRPEIFLSHPNSVTRWEDLRVIAERNGWLINAQTKPLPSASARVKK